MSAIAAIMLTGHDPARRKLAEASVECFLAQTDLNSVLRIFNQSNTPFKTHPRIAEYPIIGSKFDSLGGLKTWAVNQCPENYAALWDDDDFPSPNFLAFFRQFPLKDSLYRIQRMLVWDIPGNKAFYRINRGGFSGPMVFDRRKFSHFMPINKGENWGIRGAWSRAVAVSNPPGLYIRTWNGKNTLLKSEVLGGIKNGNAELDRADTCRLETLNRYVGND